MSNEFYAVIGARIKAKREALGWTQEGLGREIGLSREAVSTLETGRHRLFLHHFVNIADVLGIPTEELLEDYATKPQAEAESKKSCIDGLRSIKGWRENVAQGCEIVTEEIASIGKKANLRDPAVANYFKQRKAAFHTLLALGEVELLETMPEPSKGRRLEDIKGGRVFVIMGGGR